MSESTQEKIENKAAFWLKWKNTIYGVIIFVVGLMGGNVDRIPETISSALPDGVFIDAEKFEADVEKLQQDQEMQDIIIDDLGTRVYTLEQEIFSESKNRIPVL